MDFSVFYNKIILFFDYSLFGRNVGQLVQALAMFLVILFAFKFFRLFLLARLKVWAKKTVNDFDDQIVEVFEDIPQFFYYVVSLYFPLDWFVKSEDFSNVIYSIFIVVVVVYAVKFLQKFADYFLMKVTTKEGKRSATTFSGLKLFVRLILWGSAFLLILSNLGIDISSLVASLGIGGIAVALAVQNVLGDIFASFTIYFDKPFEVGDYVMINSSNDGVIKRIGLKSTRIATLQGEELVVSNKELTNAKIHNFKKMKHRRMVVNMGLEYSTSNEKMKLAKDIMLKAVEDIETLKLLRCNFVEFGPYSLNFELVYFVSSEIYDFALEKQAELLLLIKEGFEKEGIHMAFPTQKIVMNQASI